MSVVVHFAAAAGILTLLALAAVARMEAEERAPTGGRRRLAFPAAAIAGVTTVGYLGSVVGPPAVGALSAAIGLRGALVVVPLSTLTLALLARLLDA